MDLTLYQVDAFANKLFEGNPAAIIPLQSWLSDDQMQSLAGENNLSETAFFVQKENGYHIRWFTPSCEVDLCGHATLAAAYVIFNIMRLTKTNKITFESRSGLLTVKKKNDWMELDFPVQQPQRCDIPSLIIEAFNETPIECLSAEDYLVVFKDELSVQKAQPNYAILEKLALRGVIITAIGFTCDFVSRFFAPKYGINEDPVTGSAHTQLVPYWADKLGIVDLHARQLSTRGGELLCKIIDNRVLISGKAVMYMKGEISLD
jgi:PhzF family phenazine biosynthesis protein